MRKMYDSITAADIPANAAIVAGYVSGRYKWSNADWARFPHAVKVRIATQANVNDGHVLDVEPGDATPAQAPGWVHMRRLAGVVPTVYCSASTWDAVRNAFRSANVPEPLYWIARYDNRPELMAGAIAKQYINPPTSGGHYDLSIVADYWPGVENVMDAASVTQIVDAIKWQVLAGDWRFEGNRNPMDMAAQSVATGFANAAKLDAQAAHLDVLEQKLDTLTGLVSDLVHGGVTLTARGQIVVSASD